MMTIHYEENNEKKEIELREDVIVLSKLDGSKYDIIIDTLEGIRGHNIEFMVLHDLIIYLSKGNFIRDNKGNNFKDKKPLILSKHALEKNLSNKTNAMGATLFLIQKLKEHDAPKEEISILIGVLESMLNSKNFIGSTKPFPVIYT